MRDAFGYIDIDDLDACPTAGYLDEMLREQRLTKRARRRKVDTTEPNETE